MITSAFARRLLAAIVLASTAAAATTAWLAACHEVYRPPTVASYEPLDREPYFKGELGVVRPTFSQRYLVQAYRVFNGLPPLGAGPSGASPARGPAAVNQPPPNNIDDWKTQRRRVLGPGTPEPEPWLVYIDNVSVGRSIETLYLYFPNCLDDAFRSATRTLHDRYAKFQGNPALMREWIAAQDAVFANCAGGPLVLPPPSTTSNPILAADHEYQTAAAYFYATEYEEAARRFRQVALNKSSPWQPYGRYLAARALIRQATVPDHPGSVRDKLFNAAEADLHQVLRDRRAAALHGSARGLLGFIGARVRAAERLAELSRKLEREPTATRQDVEDYRWLQARVSSPSAGVDEKSSDLSDWMSTTRGKHDEAFAHAVERWMETKSTAWLVSALWNLDPSHDAPEIMSAAADVSRQSPAYATVAFLRLRLMLARGEREQARALLANLPVRPQRGFPAESINLLSAARMQLATSLDELLANSIRTVVDPSRPGSNNQLLEDDGAKLLTYRLPINRLVEASKSNVLPQRLRHRIAAAALSRALLLQRDGEAREAAITLRGLAPPFRADVNRYLAAGNEEERRRLGLLLMVRHLGMHAYVPARRDFGTAPIHDWMSEDLVGGWWCTTEDGRLKSRDFEDASGIEGLFVPSKGNGYPAFLTGEERAAAEQEIAALVRLGQPQGYLAEEAVKWAEAAPQDFRAAEALASVVRRGRWSCSVPSSSRRAFETLHRVFPKSVWAQRTKYWHVGHQ